MLAILLPTLLGAVASLQSSEVEPLLDTMFQGGSVLQRGVRAAIWGTSTDKRVTVQLLRPGTDELAVNQAVPVNASGIWLTYVPLQPAGYGYELTVSDSTGKTSVGVSFGEVILCAGQSNMGMQVGPSERAFDADNATCMLVCRQGLMVSHGWESASWADHECRWCSPNRTLARSKPNQGVCPRPPPLPAFGTKLKGLGELDCSNAALHNRHNALGPSEQNLGCNETDAYPCLTKQLVESYREQFNSSFPFISVQLPAYYTFSGQFVFPMRLAQDEGSLGTKHASIIPTYDDSCAMSKTAGCPHNNVHNVHKQPVGARLALQMRRMTLGEDIISEGPRVSRITITHASPGLQIRSNTYSLKIEFTGTSSLHMGPTRNCSICCGPSDIGEFDASSDGSHWYNGTKAVLNALSANIKVSMPGSPQIIRYTANRLYPQCAVYGEEGIPAMPFQTEVSDSTLIV